MLGKAKYALYVIGILILTLGISFTIQSDLGTSPYDALLVGLSKSVGLSVGSWEIIIALILICINSLLKRQRPELLGLLTAVITGISIDMWLFLLHNLITPEIWFSKLIFFVVGLIVTGLGTAIYLHAHFAPMPIDRLTIIIQELTKTSIFASRTVIYLAFLVMAKLFNGPIGIGTLLTVCLGGLILNYFMILTKNLLECLQDDTDTASNYHTEKNHSL